MEFKTYTCPLCGTALEEHPANRCLDAWAEGLREGYEILHFDDIKTASPYGDPFIDGDAEDEYFEYVWEGDIVTPVPYYSVSYSWEDVTVLINEFIKSDTPFSIGNGVLYFGEVLIGRSDAIVPMIARFPGDSLQHALVRCYIYWRLTSGAQFSNDSFETESQEEEECRL